MMTAQEAAERILRELKAPTSAKEIARLALERGLLRSGAKKPIDSLAQTIEKNIRDGVYNKPELRFVYGPSGRTVALPEWGNPAVIASTQEPMKEISVRIPADLLEEVQLAAYAKLSGTLDETFAVLLKRGLASVAPQVRETLMARVSKLGSA